MTPPIHFSKQAQAATRETPDPSTHKHGAKLRPAAFTTKERAVRVWGPNRRPNHSTKSPNYHFYESSDVCFGAVASRRQASPAAGYLSPLRVCGHDHDSPGRSDDGCGERKHGRCGVASAERSCGERGEPFWANSSAGDDDGELAGGPGAAAARSGSERGGQEHQDHPAARRGPDRVCGHGAAAGGRSG